MGNIQIMAKNKVKMTLVLINKYCDLGKSMGRKYNVDEQKREMFRSSLTKLFDIAARNTKEIMRVTRLLSQSPTILYSFMTSVVPGWGWIQGAGLCNTEPLVKKTKRNERERKKHAEGEGKCDNGLFGQ